MKTISVMSDTDSSGSKCPCHCSSTHNSPSRKYV